MLEDHDSGVLCATVAQQKFFNLLNKVGETLADIGWGVHAACNDLWFDLADEKFAAPEK